MDDKEQNSFSRGPEDLAVSLCLQSLEGVRETFKDDATSLSQKLCGYLGQTLKVAVAYSPYIPSALTRELNALSPREIQPREKLILDCMNNYRGNPSELFNLLSYQSDANTCAAVVHNVSELQQYAGLYNMSYENIGRYIDRFETEAPDTVSDLEQAAHYFFAYWKTYINRRGFHSFDQIPASCRTASSGNFPKPLSDRAGYFYGLYGSDENLAMLLSSYHNYFGDILIEALRRKLDPGFLKPILEKYFEEKNVKSFSFSMLTHLPWGGDHLALFRPLLIKESGIVKHIEEEDTQFLCAALELAAHVGEEELARKINEAAFNHAYENDFESDCADYFYQACIAADLQEEAEQWLSEGCPDEFDLPAALYNATDYLCARGWELEEACYTKEVERIDHELIGSKWANGFDVSDDVKFLLDSNKCSGIEKITSLIFLGDRSKNAEQSSEVN